MATSDGSGGDGGGEEGRTTSPRHPAITRAWLDTALETNRFAFEREMERQRQRFDHELKRFWRARRAP